MEGCLRGLSTAAKEPDSFVTARAAQLLHEVQALLRAYPRHNASDPSLQSGMDDLRAKFKTLLATLGLLQELYPRDAQPSLDF